MKAMLISLLLILLFLILLGCSNNESDEPEVTPRPTPTPEVEPWPWPDSGPECRHFWSQPDCLNPPVCLDCNEVGGDPLEHIWTQANFQQAATCELCGETDGDPLVPNFLRYGYRINTNQGRPFAYRTITNQNESLITTGTAILLFVDVFENYLDYDPVEGYEYVHARLMLIFDDEYAAVNGYRYMAGHIDFYNFDPDEVLIPHEDLRDSEFPEFKTVNRPLNFYGEDYEYYVKYVLVQNEWIGGIAYLVRDFLFLVPTNSDGIVIYLSNAGNWTNEAGRTVSDIFDNDSLFFRLDTRSS